MSQRQIVLDTETTGLSHAEGDRIVEIGCVEIVDRRLTGKQFHEYINPERTSGEDAVKIHGLTDEFLADKPVFAAVAEKFCNFIRDAELIIHNAPFDVGFLNAEFKRIGLPPVEELAAVTDSLVMARTRFPGRRNSLDSLCDRFGISRKARVLHGALLDAQLLAEVYLAMTRGQESLEIGSQAGYEAEMAGDDSLPPLSSIRIRVIRASAEDLKKHEDVLNDIEKGNKGVPCIWHRKEKRSSGGEGENAV